VAPRITGPLALFTSGQSAAWVTTLAPGGATSSVVDETHNTESDDKPYFNNYPPRDVTSFRYEVASPSSLPSVERRFLHAIVIGAAGAGGAPVTSVTGDGVAGAVVDGEAYVFSSAGPATRPTTVTYRVSRAATRHIVVDLAPSGAYAAAVTADGDGCKVVLSPGGALTASANGVLSFAVNACAL
jgi:hypothetical protein